MSPDRAPAATDTPTPRRTGSAPTPRMHLAALTLPDRRTALTELLPATVAVLTAAILFITYSLAQWRTMVVPSWDLAIFSELAKAYAHVQAPIVPIKGDGYNLLGDHFHPMLVVLGPIWHLFPSGLTLLVVQDLFLAVSAWPLTRLAARYLGPLVGLGLGLAYSLSWGLQGAVSAQFHEIALAVPLLAWASVAFVEQRWRSCALWALPLVLVKEDLGLTVVMVGLAMAVRGWQLSRRGDRRRRGPIPVSPDAAGTGAPANGARRVRGASTDPVRLGLALAAGGLLAFLLTVFVFLPLLNPDGVWAYGLGAGSSDGSEVGLLARLFTPQVKVETLAVLVATMGAIGLGSPWAAVVLPTLGWRFLGSVAFYWEWQNWHYNAVLMPVALGALLDVVVRLHARCDPASSTVPEAEDTSTRPAYRRWMSTPVWARWTMMVGVAVSLAVAPVTARDLPLWSMTTPEFGTPGARVASAQQVMASLTPGTSVETDLSLLAYLVPDHTVSWVGTSSTASDYVVIDNYSSAWGSDPPADAASWAESRHPGSTYTTVLDLDGFQVAQRSS